MADLSVRPALPEDAHAIAVIHAANFAALLKLGSGEEVIMDPGSFETQWLDAIEDPPSAKHRILVALEDTRVVGFAAIAPVEEPIPDADGDEGPPAEILALEVAREDRRKGHASRLLAACADILRQTGADSVQIWCVSGDKPREGFLESAGFGQRGVRRGYEIGTGTITENAWYAGL